MLEWIVSKNIPILCFQEVFTVSGRSKIKTYLEKHGYNVQIPRDECQGLLCSGLVTAISHNSYTILSASFQPFMSYHNTDGWANKGFHTLRIQCTRTSERVQIVNTHTQSDEEIIRWTIKSYRNRIRYEQAEQILAYHEGGTDPVIVVGDLNQETSLHPYLRSLHPPSTYPIKKATFFQTGEDLDHVAWMPIQWSRAHGCGFCGDYGPALTYCRVHTVTWSDHAPVEMKLLLRFPKMPQ
jgi:endonuclease/exonuclease/phosphatase family metal-dependent hydrolase